MFMAYLEMSQGCDYSIACGKKLVLLKAKTRKEAIEELKLVRDDEVDDTDYLSYDFDERWLDKVTLLEVKSSEVMPIEDWYNEYLENQKKQEEREEEEAEKKEYQRLKAKYGK